MDREPCVYLLARASHSTFYTGVTSNLMQGIHQHRSGAFSGFTARWNIKRWRRQWKYDLVARDNPAWRDLAEDFGFERLPLGKGRQAPAQGRGDG